MTVRFLKTVSVLSMSFIGMVFLMGCTVQYDLQALNERLSYLEDKFTDLEQRDALSAQESEQNRSMLLEYNQALEEKDKKLRNQSAELFVASDGLREEIQTLQGRLEEMNFNIERRLESLEGATRANQNRLNQFEHTAGTTTMGSAAPVTDLRPLPETTSLINRSDRSETVQPPSRPTTAVPAPTSTPAPTPSSSLKVEPRETARSYPATTLSDSELYISAKRAFDQGDYDTSFRKFNQLLEQYPDSMHADNAQFWIGEIYYRQKQYEQAILEYQKVIEQYPKGNKVRASHLKQGFSFYFLGDQENARHILMELIDKYPESNEAQIAQRKLDSMR